MLDHTPRHDPRFLLSSLHLSLAASALGIMQFCLKKYFDFVA